MSRGDGVVGRPSGLFPARRAIDSGEEGDWSHGRSHGEDGDSNRGRLQTPAEPLLSSAGSGPNSSAAGDRWAAGARGDRAAGVRWGERAGLPPLPHLLQTAVVLGLTAAYVMTSYALMLAAMSYNVGVIAALAFGVAAHRVLAPYSGAMPSGCP